MSGDGQLALGLDFSGIEIALNGLPPSMARRLRREWSPFVAPPSGDAFLRVRIRELERGSPGGSYRPKAMESDLRTDSARFRMPEGEAQVAADGSATIELASGPSERQYFTALNFLRACLAWRLPSRGGTLLHAAGLLVEGRAFLLLGPEGSGKSSWVRLGEQAGGQAISDDLVLLDGAAGRLELLGTPLRSTHRSPFQRGRWPLAGILFPRHGTTAALSPVAPLLARARLMANLPFIADALETDPRIAELLARLADQTPCRELTFALDPSFMDLLRGSGWS